MAWISLDRAWNQRFDFHHFYLDAAYVWEQGALNPDLKGPVPENLRQLPFYLPAVSVLLAPMAAGGPHLAAVVWTTLQLIAFGATILLLLRWSRRESGDVAIVDPLPLVVACGLSLPVIYEATKFNQLSFFVLALVLGGVIAVERRQPWRAGLLLGLALVLKLLPGIFLLWLILKREWRALAATLVAGTALTVVPSLLLFGPRQTIEYHRQWIAYNLEGASAKGMVDEDQELADHLIDRRNQSIPTVVSRLFWPGHKFRITHQPLQLSRETCVRVAYGLAAVLGLTLIWQTRRAGATLPRFAWRSEAAVYLLGMLIFSPLLRQYYLIWSLPALLLLVQAACNWHGPRSRPFGLAGLCIWLVGMLALMSWDARVLGAHLIMLILLAAVLLAAASRASDAGPPAARPAFEGIS